VTDEKLLGKAINFLFDIMKEWRAELDVAEKDAARYRWLRAEHNRPDPAMRCSAKYGFDRQSCDWVNVGDLDADIDAARASPGPIIAHSEKP
jgi:hypothetical protein